MSLDLVILGAGESGTGAALLAKAKGLVERLKRLMADGLINECPPSAKVQETRYACSSNLPAVPVFTSVPLKAIKPWKLCSSAKGSK